MHCKMKASLALHVVLLLHFQTVTLNAFIPAGNQQKLFLCQFSPTPQFRWALSPTVPTMKDLSSFSLSASDIFFSFFLVVGGDSCSLSADGMQRMQIQLLLFAGPLLRMNATLNEATLGHVCRGAVERARITIRGFACPLWHAMSQTRNAEQLLCAGTEMGDPLM